MWWSSLMTIRDQLLKQMGIVQWILRDPALLCGEHAVCIPDATQLIIIADERIDLGNLFVKDILRAMMIDSRQVCCLLTKEISLLPKEILWPCWIIGKQLPVSSKRWVIHTLPLPEIYSDPQSKRALWAQICQHENNFEFRTN
ncbi:DNA polymerase III subunit psi [Arsenophonus endosymbiont of Bemisia tabaci]|uniref:DNA polymerase III subunit psi n=1 Tax=Arsenophonus endosymbiont of Bemisia tabaci TaxID=536059 RepID=UPI001EE1808B|nr:DNA polymerase III subunit psi [Arsenophonus endosymbiont of Bemisia tabaci]